MSKNKPERIFSHWEKGLKESGVYMEFQQTNACSKLTIETLEQGVKYVKS